MKAARCLHQWDSCPARDHDGPHVCGGTWPPALRHGLYTRTLLPNDDLGPHGQDHTCLLCGKTTSLFHQDETLCYNPMCICDHPKPSESR